MRKSEFTQLLDELEAPWRERQSRMAKALPTPAPKRLKVHRFSEADIRGMSRLAKTMQAQTQRQREEKQRAQRARAEAERVTRYREVLAKATTVLHADVLAGRMGALDAAKWQATLHRHAERLPPQVSR